MNTETIKSFYEAFSAGDAEKMVSCYHDDIVFQDPAFGELKGERAKNMWRMLLGRSSDLKITFKEIHSTEESGSAKWQAIYSYGAKNRGVVNNVAAQFEFRDGKIVKHTDDFNLWKWSKQALGASGYLLGWSGFMKNKIQKTTNGLLDKFENK